MGVVGSPEYNGFGWLSSVDSGGDFQQILAAGWLSFPLDFIFSQFFFGQIWWGCWNLCKEENSKRVFFFFFIGFVFWYKI
jgi:hypothetical protein